MSDEKILVYIPVKNEEHTIKLIIEEINEKYPTWEVLVVDDGSTDNTINEIKKTNAKVATMIINTVGVGTIITAFLIAHKGNYDYLLKIDGDGQQNPDILKGLLNELKDKKADVAIGSRYLKTMKETDSFIKILGRITSSALINFKIRNRNKITDCTSGIRAWNKNGIKFLSEYYEMNGITDITMFLQKEIILMSRHGFKIVEFPAFYDKRKHGKSKSFSAKNMLFYPIRLLFLLLS